MQEMFRKSTITLPLPSPVVFTPGTLPVYTPGTPPTYVAGTLPTLSFGLALGNGQVSFTSQRGQLITSAQLCLSDTGIGAGATTVNVKVNGNAINPAGSLSIAQGAASKSVTAEITGNPNPYPGGERINPGDTITVDVTAVPATTAPKAGFVVLDIIEVDV
jgi:hypothetical protein